MSSRQTAQYYRLGIFVLIGAAALVVLVLIFGAVPLEDPSQPAFVHYLDDVQVSLLTSEPLP